MFLLLLFVVWIASVAPVGPIDPLELQRRINQLEQQVEKQQGQLKELEGWKSEYEAFIRSLGIPVPTTLNELRARTARNNAPQNRGGKDLPPCAPTANRLLGAGVVNGEVQIQFLAEFPPLPYRRGQVLVGDDVGLAISAIVAYQNQNDCRFHYRLDYSADSDYRLGAQRFGPMFYPDGDLRISGP